MLRICRAPLFFALSWSLGCVAPLETQADGPIADGPIADAARGADAPRGFDAAFLLADAGPTREDARRSDAPTALVNDTCDDAIKISTVGSTHVDVQFTTVGATPNLAAPCGSAPAPDVFFTFTLQQRELVYADTFGTGFDTTLFFASSCSTPIATATTSGDSLCSNDACGTSQSQVVALLVAGTYYIVVGGGQGQGTLHFEHAPVGGNAPVQPLAAGTSSPTGTTSALCSVCACEAAGGESAFWWQTCPADPGGAFTASTCGSATFDTVLSLRIPAAADVPACNSDDETCAPRSTLTTILPAGAGLFVLGVLGESANDTGPYTLSTTRP